ncbi:MULTISPECIES: 16S rRNA (cytidine(1402)-2'-O)-methyltransferase [Clostridiaceae]|uniref:Ribosomal RNA small subunit methyltransferase I n=1 Tax=Clostridium facile TaxID=2763035 RepID=A0ABR7ITE3_9CLOT|nr:16S rRNA (cytidine(1402)-2'-O)-methyltransferase [Massilioclostridium coli]MBC5788420.1 16S rRNA (cytidine(1402)-2'-O)-methyltransferase [Clostridium facile]
MAGILYVVGTPIGNLSDFSPRAVETLQQVDFIAAEDTRVTLKLLNHFGIKKPMVSYYEHNLRQRGEQIIQRILAGENCAIVSDAGMPCISDPGEDLVRLCAEYQIETRVVPGPSAVISALCVSGLVTSRFSFEGFLSTNKRSRLEHLTSIRKDTHTLIFYEAPHKLLSTLKDLYETLGDRKISLVKEITKLHESVNRTTLAQAVQYYTENTPKGEFVLVLEGAVIAENNEEEMTLEQAVQLAKELMEQGHRPSDAAKEAAKLTQFKKAEIYKQLID